MQDQTNTEKRDEELIRNLKRYTLGVIAGGSVFIGSLMCTLFNKQPMPPSRYQEAKTLLSHIEQARSITDDSVEYLQMNESLRKYAQELNLNVDQIEKEDPEVANYHNKLKEYNHLNNCFLLASLTGLVVMAYTTISTDKRRKKILSEARTNTQ